MKENNDLLTISIIVPVYNVKAYLKKCLDSLVNQTYKNIQIILVDDGSKDGSSEICDRYAEKDERVLVIHKNNKGVAYARETGIAHASGKYIMFVDADDWIDKRTCEECIKVAEIKNSECVMFGYIKEYETTSLSVPLFDKDFSLDEEKSEQKIHRRIIGMDNKELKHPERIDVLSPVWGKLYRNDIAKKGRIVSERVTGTSEDTIFNIYALEKCRVSYVNQCLYHYRKTNEQSITSKHKDNLPEKWDILYQIFKEYLEKSDFSKEYYTYFLNRVACGTIGLGLNEISGNARFCVKVNRIEAILQRELYKEAFSKVDFKYCSLKWKIFFFLCKKKASILLTLLLIIVNFLRYKMVS